MLARSIGDVFITEIDHNPKLDRCFEKIRKLYLQMQSKYQLKMDLREPTLNSF